MSDYVSDYEANNALADIETNTPEFRASYEQTLRAAVQDVRQAHWEANQKVVRGRYAADMAAAKSMNERFMIRRKYEEKEGLADSMPAGYGGNLDLSAEVQRVKNSAIVAAAQLTRQAQVARLKAEDESPLAFAYQKAMKENRGGPETARKIRQQFFSMGYSPDGVTAPEPVALPSGAALEKLRAEYESEYSKAQTGPLKRHIRQVFRDKGLNI
jgi:hypothetical protein